MSVGSSKAKLVEEFNARLVWLGLDGEGRVFEGEIKVDAAGRVIHCSCGHCSCGADGTAGGAQAWLRPPTDGPSLSRVESDAET